MFDQKIKDVKATIERIKAMLAAKSFDSVYFVACGGSRATMNPGEIYSGKRNR